MAKKAIVTGAGFAGLSAASFLAKEGWEVVVLEKHATAGGRARQLKENGFIPLILTILFVVAAVIYLVYTRVLHAKSS